jgi:hypothetical protein
MKISMNGKVMKFKPENDAEVYQLEHIAKEMREEGLCTAEIRQWEIKELSITVERKPQ